MYGKTEKQKRNESDDKKPTDDICQVTSDGIIITVEVSAGSKQSIFPDGYNSWRKAFGISVKAPPMEGKANKAIIELIASQLHISKNAVTIISGHTASVKKIQITGISRQQLIDLSADK
jgi:uncharacterized protein (TIGR00251 family)